MADQGQGYPGVVHKYQNASEEREIMLSEHLDAPVSRVNPT